MNIYKVGIISDTHGLLRDEVIKVFQGSNLIIHAGDIDNFEIIEKLKVVPCCSYTWKLQ